VSHAPATAIAWPWETDDPDDGSSAEVIDLHRVTPELVLVCPELREAALALLPDRDPDGWIPRRIAPPAPIELPRVEAPPARAGNDAGDVYSLPPTPTGRALILAAGVYTGQSLVGAAIAGGALVGATVALAGLADVLHP
jgi:hypothetical protein